MARKLTKRALLERVYDSLYAEAEAVLKKFNPCQHRNVGKKDYSCLSLRQDKIPEAIKVTALSTGCCGGCKFLTAQGCTAEKPLTCKTWLCSAASWKNPPDCRDALNIISSKASNFGFYVHRGDKSDSINQSLQYRLTIKNILAKINQLNISI